MVINWWDFRLICGGVIYITKMLHVNDYYLRTFGSEA